LPGARGVTEADINVGHRGAPDALTAYILSIGENDVMDSKSLRQVKIGARLWHLPPYSPDLKPIEQAFAKIKHWIRAAQKRTLEDTWRPVGSLVASIGPDECGNYFANAGYASVKV
jgi:hypothetical protein